MAVQDTVGDAGSIPIDVVGEAGGRIAANIESVIEGKPEVVRLRHHRAARRGPPADRGRARASARRCWPRRWPGRSTARCAGSSSRRTCCPSDITGVSVYNQERRDFEFKPGAVFANIVVGDEINRASPKTQSALLECMEERQVTVDGTTYRLRGAVHGGRHAEPDRDGGHLPPARGAARPVHGPGVDGLPGRARPSWRCSTTTPASPARRPAAGRPTPPTVAKLIDAVRDASTSSRRREAVRGRPGHAPPATPPTSGSAPRRAPRCTCCAPPRRRPR